MNTYVIEALSREPAAVKRSRAGISAAALALALLSTLTGCGTDVSQPPPPGPTLASQSRPLAGDGKLQPGEQCDDGNTTNGDGCSSTGVIESGYLCHVPGRACSLASLCGNNTADPGEACDDGNTTDNGNGCSATCDLSQCGNGVFNNRQYPSFAQETCDDGNRFEGDGCSRLCEVEPGFACAGNPSRCVRAGVALFNTGVDAHNRRLETGKDPHWFYVGTTTGADPGPRNASDWPQESQTARFMAPQGSFTCVYQDFMVPSTTNIPQFRLQLATFNDNDFSSAKVNGVGFTPIIVNNPPGESWQKNVFREFGTSAAWRAGLNRIELCNENDPDQEPNAFRYLFVDAYDDKCGDGVISLREECDDGNATPGDGCNASCGMEPGYACTGQPSKCAATCGNGVQNAGEQCDDGNTTAGDGCNRSCRVEAGHACPIAGQSCVKTCGNGAIDPGEQCDDGNGYNSDGCSAACLTERGYECAGAPSACAPLCGNGRMDSGELCDDGNITRGDGCSNACTLELGYACPTVGQPCVKTCGNGTVDPGEQCDDNDLEPLDGCGTECRVEPGYACSTPSSAPSVCAATCGNGALDPNEQCDDNNTKAGDGCTPGCRIETGYSCSGAPSTCSTVCGDGIMAGGEQCDTGNTTADDGCDASCRIETGWRCPAPGTVCFQTCGNGTVESGERCDDGNTTAGDGCGGTCQVESGYSCSGAPSACRTTCGDGIVAGTEVCDDGNLSGGDTCSPRCLWDVGQACTASGVCDGVCNPTTNTCALTNVCGNGFVEGSESCDDGNTASGDGCGSTCASEPGSSCYGNAPSICHPNCGDGRLGEGEQCDDSNITAGDGCAPHCAIEAGYSCTGNPSVCAVRCGDGVKAASEACDDGNTVSGDGCDSACAVESGFSCQNTGVQAFFTRRGRTDCTQVSSITAPSLASSTSQPALSVPGRYRMHYVSGAVSYSSGVNWFPGILGVNVDAGAGVQRFSLGIDSPAVPPSATRDEAMTLGFPLLRDFDAGTGEVRLALIGTDCGLGNNSDTTVTYRVDALSICQWIPAITSPSSGGLSGPNIGGTASPGATVHVYIDGGTTPACTATADASGHWTCTLSSVGAGPHSAVVTSTIVGATETAPAINFTLDLTPPAAPVITGPKPDSVLATSTPALSGTADPGSLVTVREGSTVLCTVTANDSGKWSCTPSTPLADGPHTVTATASNAAGNTSPVSNSVTFTTDTQAPDTTISHGPASHTEDNAAAFGYSSSENGVRYECSLDGTAYAPCKDAYDVKPGEHTLRVRAVDAAGNVDATPAVYTWTVEDTRAFAGGGCSAAPASSWFALLGLLGLRRRNRR
ncbi:DUF4215 domain-containing protein [Archangium sp. Cb G35]|uniref:DUF4215 domain-containing protein n=1 Tax=Archangium sp. Cb G35 TaxID=1920190 RepID=UPI0009FB69A6|nr:DUF4215 domain-containing protein [Archangium sp. Cb G35]